MDQFIVNEIGLSAEEKERARLPEKPENPGTAESCSVCGKPIEPEGFCAEFGIFHERWLCDQHVHEFRGSQQHLQPKKPMERGDVELAIGITEGAIKNLAMIDKIDARDSSGASRGFELAMTFKQSRPILRAILEVLKLKLTAFPPVPPPIVEVDPE
jgi:hypothetical protein